MCFLQNGGHFAEYSVHITSCVSIIIQFLSRKTRALGTLVLFWKASFIDSWLIKSAKSRLTCAFVYIWQYFLYTHFVYFPSNVYFQHISFSCILHTRSLDSYQLKRYIMKNRAFHRLGKHQITSCGLLWQNYYIVPPSWENDYMVPFKFLHYFLDIFIFVKQQLHIRNFDGNKKHTNVIKHPRISYINYKGYFSVGGWNHMVCTHKTDVIYP